jgi:hypothetical protein
MKINFFSAYGAGALRFRFPFSIAFDEAGPNCFMYRKIRERPRMILGITVMDFPGEDLIEGIVNTNAL